jgi:hypothetical protein
MLNRQFCGRLSVRQDFYLRYRRAIKLLYRPAAHLHSILSLAFASSMLDGGSAPPRLSGAFLFAFHHEPDRARSEPWGKSGRRF